MARAGGCHGSRFQSFRHYLRTEAELFGALRGARRAVVHSAAHNSERDAVLDRRELETIALQQDMGAISISDVRRAAVEREESGELIEVT